MAGSFMSLRSQLRHQLSKSHSILLAIITSPYHGYFLANYPVGFESYFIFPFFKIKIKPPTTYILFFTIITTITIYGSVMDSVNLKWQCNIQHSYSDFPSSLSKKNSSILGLYSAKQHCLPVVGPGIEPRTSWNWFES